MIQYLFLAPGNLDKNGVLDALNAAFPPDSGETPRSGIMPGTRQHNGKWAVHSQYDVTQEELQGALNALNAWDMIAAQDYHFERDEGGNIIGGTLLPVPLTFIDWIADKYDENDNPVRPTHPVPVPHTYAGADPWIWEDAVPAGASFSLPFSLFSPGA